MLLLAGLSLGICLSRSIQLPLPLLLGTTIVVTASTYYALRRLRITRLIGLAIISLLCGMTCMQLQQVSMQTPLLRWVDTHQATPAIISGSIGAPIRSLGYRQAYYLTSDSISIDGHIIITKAPVCIVIGSADTTAELRDLRRNDKVKIFCTIEDIRKERNPGSSNWFSVKLLQEGTPLLATVKSRYDIRFLDSSNSATIFEHIGDLSDSLQHIAAAILSAAIRDSEALALTTAMVLGNSESLSREIKAEFQSAGLAHVLVVSGFNVAIVALVLYYLLRLLGLVALRPRVLLTMLLIALYSLVVGYQPSILRATMAVELFLCSLLLERRMDVANTTAAIAALSLMIEPYQLFDAGFQLSYGAVFSLVLITPSLQRLLIPKQVLEAKQGVKKWLRNALELFLTTIAVTLGLLPITAYHFHQLQIKGLLINIIGIPLSSLITVFGFLLLPLYAISSWVGMLYGEVTTFFAKLLIGISHGSSYFPFQVPVARFTITACIGYFLLLTYILVARHRKQFFARVAVSASIILSYIGIGLPLHSSVLGSGEKLSVLFFDVGQGDAALIKTPGGHTYTIDFGGLYGTNTVVADRTIVPFLESEGIRSVDAGFISHLHADHYAGLLTLIPNDLIHTIYTSGEQTSSSLTYKLDSIISNEHTAVHTLMRGDKMQLDSEVMLYVLNPVATAISDDDNSEINHNSLVCKIVYKDRSILFLGDIEAADEERLVKQYGDFLKSDVVKVAHHGSKFSSSLAFTQKTKPEYAVISVGEHNRFGHPGAESISRWHNAGSEVLRTDREGAVLFETDGKTIKKIDWR